MSVVLFVVLASPNIAFGIPSFEDVKTKWQSSEVMIYDRKDRLIQTVRTDYKKRALKWVGINDISRNMVDAVLSSEDRRFFEHSGVDWLAVGSALLENITGRSTRGASTITMQLASILIGQKGKKDINEKIRQIKTARQLEDIWTKDNILEAYLNLIYFRGDLQGISSAANILFGKSPSSLTAIESAMLASLIRNPNASVQKVVFRTCNILDKMQIPYDKESVNKTVSDALMLVKSNKNSPSFAPHIVRHLDLSSGKRIKTTIDMDLQTFAQETLKKHLMVLQRSNVNEGATVIIENKTGNVLAYLSVSNDFKHVDGVVAKRQAGSTLKPFLYALALSRGVLNASSLLEDAPVSISTERGLYLPKNYNESYKGLVTVRTALASSLNTPAVKTLTMVGIEDFYEILVKLGFDINENADFYGYALALGGVDVSLLELTNAYRVLANGGIFSRTRFSYSQGRAVSKRVLGEDVAFIISDILSDRAARQVTFGMENPLSTKSWSAVKTGTSKDMRDNWCIGYSDTYTVGVWVGNFSGAAMWNISGISGSAQIWQEIMNHLHRQKFSRQPKAPKDVVKKDIFIDSFSGVVSEWFIKDSQIPTDNSLIAVSRQGHEARIIYPPTSTVIVIDPDIPNTEQAVFFEIMGGNIGMSVFVGDDKIAIYGNIAIWQPRVGQHKVRLIDVKGAIRDEIEIFVR
ncbi:MAG: penicillin-binding protein 1C [Thermodesulfovibrionales bacterium]|nr:penicillin-binding protein 1C [Thermodesulfovibrionales bacterium]